MDTNNPKNAALQSEAAAPEVGVPVKHIAPIEALTGLNIVDSDGVDLNSTSDYKIMMSDGTELGMIRDPIGWLADESPSNGGVIIEYNPTSPDFVVGKPWVNATSAFIRGASYNDNGGVIKQYLYAFKLGVIGHVGWTTTTAQATKFLAFNVAGNRVSLRAEVGGVGQGIRLNKAKKQLELEVDIHNMNLPLACQFVRVQTIPAITVP